MPRQPYMLIIGGGQGGIALGARLRQLGVPTIIVEKNERAGDSWRKRYKSLCLHDPVWYDHLPYIDFPKNWPVFSPKDKIGDWLEMYAKVMELNYWSSTEAKSATYDDKKKEWTVVVSRDGKDIIAEAEAAGVGDRHVRQGQHAEFQGHGQLQGRAAPLLAASRPRCLRRQEGRRHRLEQFRARHSAALCEAGVDVTMVQRSTTHIVKSDTLMEIGLGSLYSEQAVRDGMTTAKADLDLCLPALQDPARVPDPGLR